MPEEFKCEVCGKTFDTKRGLHVHQSQVHPDMDKEEKKPEKEEKKTKKKAPKKPEKPRAGPWKAATGILVVLLIASLYFGFTGNIGDETDGGISKEEVATKTIDFINTNMVAQGEAELGNVTEESGLYKVTTIYMNQSVPIYVTKDGEKLILSNGVVDMSKFEAQMENQTQDQGSENTDQGGEQQTDVPKSETPTVQLFVMSFCPYGSRAEDTMEPVFELLGDAVNWKPHYIVSESNGEIRSLHGSKEVQQNMREACVLKNHGVNKWFDFVTYVNGNCGSNGNCWEEAANEAGLDTSKISTCVEERGTELMKEEAQISSQEGASGSPTLLINGKESRAVYQYENPEAYKDAICSAFENPPEECDQELQGSGSSSSGGQC